MEYAASLQKRHINMKLYMRGDTICMELTRDMKPHELALVDVNVDKILEKITPGTPVNITRDGIYIKDFHLDMINNVG